MPRAFSPTPLTLGTAQLGAPYGVANASGLPSDEEARAILDAALAAGIATIDTARAYGHSEARIGDWLANRDREAAGVRLVTKIPPVPEGSAVERRRFVRDSLDASIAALGRRPLDLVLVHRGRDLLDATVREALEAACEAGTIAGFGASVYAPDDALRLLADVPIAALQAPVSVVDRRMEASGALAAAEARGVTVFTRSAFLQGALLMDPARLPSHLSALAPARAALDRLAAELDLPLALLALLGVRDLRGVSSIVVGVERADQIAPHVPALHAPPLPSEAMAAIAAIAGALPEDLIDPSRWPRP